MATPKWISRLFQSIDDNDPDTFATFLTDDAIFKFANQDPAVGKAAARQTVAEFLSSIKAIQHDVLDVWEKDGATSCHGLVTYTRHDSSQLQVPFANVFKMQGSLIQEYLIYVDASQLYAEAA